MFLNSIFLSGLGLAYIASGIPVYNEGEISGEKDAFKLAVREVTNLPTALITCPDTRDGKDPANDKISFNDFQVEDAVERGLNSAPGSSDANPGGYSHEFRNDEAFVFAGCPGQTLYEYPILETGIYGGGPPGPFRVIFGADFAARKGPFCGILYHPRNPDGSESTGFDLCT